MLWASARVNPVENLFFSDDFDSSITSSSSSTIGVISMLFKPTSLIWFKISCLAPLPIASMAITAATPKIIPRAVSTALNLLAIMASSAISILYKYLSKLYCFRSSMRSLSLFSGALSRMSSFSVSPSTTTISFSLRCPVFICCL
ncbi:MAG: hypothetical protein BWY70_01841 [Bacteroidetes bacterium ADurb.Bin408]|nr:MAG: hypothetical protein BWY70_01841 [Bacteroidetes bacterium ADurb.Bin408]